MKGHPLIQHWNYSGWKRLVADEYWKEHFEGCTLQAHSKGTQCNGARKEEAENKITYRSKFMLGYSLWCFGSSVHFFLLFSVRVFVGVKFVEEWAA